MHNNNQKENLDHILNLLSNPISRYILSVLAGIDPGIYAGQLPEEVDSPSENGEHR